eukprot:g41262.t1
MNTVLLCNLFSVPRIAYAMSEDGLLFKVFARVNPVTKVPVIGIVLFGILMAILAMVFDLESLVQFLSIGTLLAYTFVAASTIVLRYQTDKAKRSETPPPNPSPQTQDGGGLKEYESFSDKLQLVERQKAAKERREPGQLKSSFEPYLHFLTDFVPGEVVTVAVISLVLCTICLCCILVFGISHLQLPQWAYVLFIVFFAIGFLLSLFLIWIHEQHQKLNTFQNINSEFLDYQPNDITTLLYLSLGSFGALDSWNQYLTECIPDVKAQFIDLGEILHLDSY